MITQKGDLQDDWEYLLSIGDATTLIAHFREAIYTTSEDLVPLSSFLESRVFAAALKIDLESLKRISSSALFNDQLAVVNSHPLDAREVLTQLLSINEFNSGHGVLAYIRLIRATFRQVFLDAIRRARDCVTIADKLVKAGLIIKAWYPGMIKAVLQSLLALVQRDAHPKMVQTNKCLDSFPSSKCFNAVYNDKCADGDDKNGNDYMSDEEKESDTSKTLELGTLRALLQLSLDTMQILGDSSQTIPLLLMVKALVLATQPYSDEKEYLGKAGANTRQWLTEQCQEKCIRSSKSALVACARSETCGVKKENSFSPEILREIAEIDACITREILNLTPSEGLLPFFFKYVKKDFPKDVIESAAFEGNERGRGSTDLKAFTLIRDFRDELNTLQILSEDDSLSDEEDAVNKETESLQKIGALLFLHDALSFVSLECTFFFAVSPKAFFFLSGPFVLESLNSTSLGVVMCGMIFLALILSNLSPHCIGVPGERSKEVERQQEREFIKPNEGSADFRTRRFELIFEIIKSLLNVSTLCPSETHRVMARMLVNTVLKRCDLELRLLLYSSFLIVTPYPSICSIMMQYLLEEWNNSRPDSCGDAQFMRLMNVVPKYLLLSDDRWLRRIKIGEVAFVEPLIQSFNFIRLVIVETRRRYRGTHTIFKFDPETGKVQLLSDKTKSETAWEVLLKKIFTEMKIPLRAMLRASDDYGGTANGIVSSAGLSPVDCFSLSMSLDGLEKEVMEIS